MARELKAARLKREIEERQKELYDHQEKCKHTRGTYRYRSNTGNYDPHCDSYWVETECGVCGKRDMFDSDTNTYKLIGKCKNWTKK